MHSPVRSSHERATRPRIIVLSVTAPLILGVLMMTLVVKLLRGPTVSQAESALIKGDSATALRLAERILKKHPTGIDALLIAGRAASTQKQYDAALRYFRQASEGGQSITPLIRCAQLSVQLGHLADGERFFRRALAVDPNNLDAHEGLVKLMRLEGRTWEVLPHVYELFRREQFAVEYLEVAGTLEASWVNQNRDVPFLNYCFRVQPEDPTALLGVIRLLIARQLDIAVAREELTAIVASHPHLVEAQAMLGQLVLEGDVAEEFITWHSQLPAEADQHPSIWVTRGRWVHRQRDTRGAIRCLCEALRRCPNDRAANLLVAQLLASIGDGARSQLFQQRGDDLLAFDDALLRGELENGKRAPARLMTMVAALERLGRLWEAVGWSLHLLEVDPGSQFAAETIRRLRQQLSPGLPLTLASANPANSIDLAEFPLPAWPSVDIARTSSDAVSGFDSAIAFADVSGRVGLNFRYFLDHRRLRRSVYTFDFAGGGVGAWDYDLDGWPDLYLSQSCRWPPADEDKTLRNALFRNRDGEWLDEVSGLADAHDFGFGQGIAVGDFNNDGFPDVYVCNVGPNRLFVNNGDGTFWDWTAGSGTAGSEFSLSAVIADLNGDRWPDLYVTNYLGGDALTRQCDDGGRPVQCAPILFPGQQDRLYMNLGDGGFREVTDEAGVLDLPATGKGMGILAADFDGNGGLDLLVTNDTTANFLYVNAAEPGGVVKMIERGRIAGIAYDERGRLQGSMGIAAADVSQDGMIDIFVTNFYAEPNNLFCQVARQPITLFKDAVLDAALYEPSIHRVGWGAQFLDAELDGDWDLFVANGHLDENASESHDGGMLPQFFENGGTARFREAAANELGDYFHSKYYGRAVARLDWNRDGMDDLCVTHRGDPVSLLENRSSRLGRFVAIQLRGTVSSRDPVGTEIQIVAGGRQRTVQLLAGDGFEASNQRQLVVGLGECDRVDQLTIRWPAGGEQVHRDLEIDREWIFVEGREPPYSLHR